MVETTIVVPVAAAIRTADGLIHTLPAPHRHHHIIHAMHIAKGTGRVSPSDIVEARGEQGFLLSDGNFADRVVAGRLALKWGMVRKLQHPPNLYTEDLW